MIQTKYENINAILSEFRKECLSMDVRALSKKINDSYVSFT
jgi:hypothetical protein